MALPRRRAAGTPITVAEPAVPRRERWTLLGVVVNLNHPAHFVHWGFFQMSISNLIAIIVMLVVFAAAILLPFPGHRRRGGAS